MLPLIFIVIGCSTQNKREQLLSIQQQRILKLEQALLQKEKVINKMKVSRWVGQPVRVSEAVAFTKLNRLIENKKWVQALKESARLKKRYPKSIRLSGHRLKIFRAMGLSKQARKEGFMLKKLRAQNLRKRKSVLNGL